jgi:hypothetical protein
MDNKPRVFPTPEQIAMANQTGDEIAKKQEETITSGQVSTGEAAAAAEMARRTAEQLRLREERLKQIELETEMVANNAEPSMVQVPDNTYVQPIQQVSPVENKQNYINEGNTIKKPDFSDKDIELLSEPQMNQPYDIIPLPSEGKLYPNKKGKVKVAFLTTADENILTSPNLLNSGDFLEILINRKLLEPGLRYKDLLPGDRDAIMIFLRSTGYGEIYPVTILDENNKPFDTEIDLSQLKIKKLNVESDSEGLFSYQLPITKSIVKFKLLTVGEESELEKMIEFIEQENKLINMTATITLENQIVEIDGNRDRNFIRDFVENLRLMDGKKLREYISSIECGVDTKVQFQTPGGGSVSRFLPFTLKFFWPEFEL